jgi:voltage-gated potassium channel
MIVLLLFAFALTAVTVIIHALGTLGALAHLARAWHRRKGEHWLWAAEIQIVRVVTLLLLLHLIEAGVWAGLYVISGILPNTETALYFSLTSYTTVGYGDVVLQPPWRLLGPIESAVGILMFGWSTGIMVAAINRTYAGRFRNQSDAQANGNEGGQL